MLVKLMENNNGRLVRIAFVDEYGPVFMQPSLG